MLNLAPESLPARSLLFLGVVVPSPSEQRAAGSQASALNTRAAPAACWTGCVRPSVLGRSRRVPLTVITVFLRGRGERLTAYLDCRALSLLSTPSLGSPRSEPSRAQPAPATWGPVGPAWQARYLPCLPRTSDSPAHLLILDFSKREPF